MNKYLAALAVATVLIVLTIFAVDRESTFSKTIVSLTTNTRPSERCRRIKDATKTPPPLTPEAPPWLSLLANISNNNDSATNRSSKVFYVWPSLTGTLRLGNRLFIYAALFGIAWRNNGRVPIYPDTSGGVRHYDLPRYFKLRIPTDKGNRIITVRYENSCSSFQVFSRFSAPRVWNSLPVSIRESQSLPTFRRHPNAFYFQSAYLLSAAHLIQNISSTRSDSSKTLALYKSCTYLLT